MLTTHVSFNRLPGNRQSSPYIHTQVPLWFKVDSRQGQTVAGSIGVARCRFGRAQRPTPSASVFGANCAEPDRPRPLFLHPVKQGECVDGRETSEGRGRGKRADKVAQATKFNTNRELTNFFEACCGEQYELTEHDSFLWGLGLGGRKINSNCIQSCII